MNKNFKNYQHKSFLQDISQVPWSAVDCFDNIEHSHNAFNLLFKEVLDEHTPKKKKKKKEDEITEPIKPVYYGQSKRTYENKGVLAEVSEKNRRSRRLDEIQES